MPHRAVGGVRPQVLLSVAVSMDGYIDDTGPVRFPLSNAADCARRVARVADDKPAHPLGVVITACGDLDPGRAFWHQDAARVVYPTADGLAAAMAAVGVLAVAAAGLADFPGDPARRFHLAEIGDIAVLRYLPKLISA